MKDSTRRWILKEKASWAAHEIFKRGLILEEPIGFETRLKTWKRRNIQGGWE